MSERQSYIDFLPQNFRFTPLSTFSHWRRSLSEVWSHSAVSFVCFVKILNFLCRNWRVEIENYVKWSIFSCMLETTFTHDNKATDSTQAKQSNARKTRHIISHFLKLKFRFELIKDFIHHKMLKSSCIFQRAAFAWYTSFQSKIWMHKYNTNTKDSMWSSNTMLKL